MKVISLFTVLSLAFCVICCSKPVKTEKEKGEDYATKKLDYAEGAAGVVAEKSENLGEKAGKGVGNLIQGLGKGLGNALYPPVTITPDSAVSAAGIKVNKAEEGSSGSFGSEVKVALHFSKLYKGRFELHAMNNQNVEIGRAVSKFVNQPPNSLLNASLHFHKDTKMAEVDHCKMVLVAPRAVTVVLAAGMDEKSVALGQMHEKEGTPLTINQYVIFNNAFTGSIQMRAFDTTNTEIGRSQKVKELDQEEDSSKTFEFTFHSTVTVDSIARYELHVKPGKPTVEKKPGKK